jgi:hypothetical protein
VYSNYQWNHDLKERAKPCEEDSPQYDKNKASPNQRCFKQQLYRDDFDEYTILSVDMTAHSSDNNRDIEEEEGESRRWNYFCSELLAGQIKEGWLEKSIHVVAMLIHRGALHVDYTLLSTLRTHNAYMEVQ